MDATVVPQGIEPAVDGQRSAFAEVALKHFAVVADLTDNLHDPIFGQLQVFAVFTVGTQQPRDIRVFRRFGFGDHAVLEVMPASSALSTA